MEDTAGGSCEVGVNVLASEVAGEASESASAAAVHHRITSHHMEKTEAGIREITLS